MKVNKSTRLWYIWLDEQEDQISEKGNEPMEVLYRYTIIYMNKSTKWKGEMWNFEIRSNEQRNHAMVKSKIDNVDGW